MQPRMGKKENDLAVKIVLQLLQNFLAKIERVGKYPCGKVVAANHRHSLKCFTKNYFTCYNTTV